MLKEAVLIVTSTLRVAKHGPCTKLLSDVIIFCIPVVLIA
jgi:hypothetical protein